MASETQDLCMVTFPVVGYYSPLTSANSCCLVAEASACKQLAQVLGLGKTLSTCIEKSQLPQTDPRDAVRLVYRVVHNAGRPAVVINWRQSSVNC